MTAVKVLLLSAISFPALTGCLYSGDVDLSCSGVETKMTEQITSPSKNTITTAQSNRVIELSLQRHYGSFADLIEEPLYQVEVDSFLNFDNVRSARDETTMVSWVNLGSFYRRFSYDKKTNILQVTYFVTDSLSSGKVTKVSFEGVCSEQSRIVK